MRITVTFFFAIGILTGHAVIVDAFQPTSTRIHVNHVASYHKDTFLKANKDGNNTSKRKAIRNKVSTFAKQFTTKSTTAIDPQAIASILTDSTRGAVDLALDEIGQIRQSLAYDDILEKGAALECDTAIALDTIALAKTTAADAFALAETAIEETEEALRKSKLALEQCRKDVAKAISVADLSAYQANLASQKATILATSAAISASDKGATMTEDEAGDGDDDIREEKKVAATGKAAVAELVQESMTVARVEDDTKTDVSALDYGDVDYHLSEMSPPFIGEDQCLVPGEAVVRVEKAKDNSRRIFAGIDILASVDDVWNVSLMCRACTFSTCTHWRCWAVLVVRTP